MRYVTRDQLMAALSCTPQNLYGREGKTLPRPIILDADGGSIRAYDLADLLWIVGASERELICTGLGLDVHRLRVGFAAVCSVQAGSVSRQRIEDEDDTGPENDPLLA